MAKTNGIAIMQTLERMRKKGLIIPTDGRDNNISAQAQQATEDGELQYCPNCKKVQPFELTKYNPDTDEEPNLISCLICGEAIDFIENL